MLQIQAKLSAKYAKLKNHDIALNFIEVSVILELKTNKCDHLGGELRYFSEVLRQTGNGINLNQTQI